MNYISKWKYLKITTGDMMWGTDNLTKEDLLRAKNRNYKTILNLEELTYYNAEENAWLSIDGEKA